MTSACTLIIEKKKKKKFIRQYEETKTHIKNTNWQVAREVK